jgi:hypothetical protein
LRLGFLPMLMTEHDAVSTVDFDIANDFDMAKSDFH